MEMAGFRGFILNWFWSYLENRSQRVKIDDVKSNVKYLNVGVPQGSVLGPILFLIYINSLLDLRFKGLSTAFADDVGFSYRSNSPLELVCDVNWDLDLLRKWFAVHNLVISSKTKIMFFSLASYNNFEPDIFFHDPDCPKFKLTNCHYPFEDSSASCFYNHNCSDKCFLIERVDEFKYLGLILDSKMSFSNHVNNLKKYFRFTLRHFFYLRKVCSSNLLLKIYYGIFHSKLQYGINCWGGVYNNKIRQILKLQKCVIRIICRKPRRHASIHLFRALNILPARHLYCYKVLKIFFMKSGHRNFRIIRNYNIRGNFSNLLSVPFFRTTAYRNFYSVLSHRLFNSLPSTIRTLTSSGIFLQTVKDWLLNFDYISLESHIF